MFRDKHWVCFSFDTDSSQISTFENQRLGPPERILPWIFLQPPYLPMQFNVMCVMGLKNDKLQKQENNLYNTRRFQNKDKTFKYFKQSLLILKMCEKNAHEFF